MIWKQVFLLLILTSGLGAEIIELKAKINFLPKKSIGIIFNQSGTKYYNETNINEIKSGETIISFRVNDYVPDSFASALVLGSEGQVAFASVQKLANLEDSAIVNLPECQEPVSEDYSQQKGLLAELVELRLQRQELQKLKLKEYLKPEFTNELIALEKKYGIQEIELLTPQTAPEVLNLRLFRLINAIK
ncbi:MAG: hypothetical protein WD512_01600 [Candidatus Paceibacterota bacterium]